MINPPDMIVEDLDPSSIRAPEDILTQTGASVVIPSPILEVIGIGPGAKPLRAPVDRALAELLSAFLISSGGALASFEDIEISSPFPTSAEALILDGKLWGQGQETE